MTHMNKIFEARKAAKFSQADVASQLGKTQPTISGWESGEYSPDLKDIFAMCELFSVTPNQLLGFGDAPDIEIEKKPEVAGAYIACDDGDILTLTREEETYLLKCLAKARDGKRNPDVLDTDYRKKTTYG